jgi:ribosomal protein S17
MSDPQGGATATEGGLSRGYRKVREGLVVSDKMDKTVVVAVENRVRHARYAKTMRRTSRWNVLRCCSDTSVPSVIGTCTTPRATA